MKAVVCETDIGTSQHRCSHHEGENVCRACLCSHFLLETVLAGRWVETPPTVSRLGHYTQLLAVSGSWGGQVQVLQSETITVETTLRGLCNHPLSPFLRLRNSLLLVNVARGCRDWSRWNSTKASLWPQYQLMSENTKLTSKDFLIPSSMTFITKANTDSISSCDISHHPASTPGSCSTRGGMIGNTKSALQLGNHRRFPSEPHRGCSHPAWTTPETRTDRQGRKHTLFKRKHWR